jgi:hypothetical protein
MELPIRISPLGNNQPSTTDSLPSSEVDECAILDSPINMELLGCGFNAHGQLNGRDTTDSTEDRKSFTTLAVSKNIRIIFAGWSATVVILGTGIQIAGHIERVPDYTTTKHSYIELGSGTTKLLLVYGTAGGPIGLTSKCKHIWYAHRFTASFENDLLIYSPRHIEGNPDGVPNKLWLHQRRPKNREQPKLVAISHTNLTCVVLPAPSVKEQSRVFEFDNYETFTTWSALDNPLDPDLMPEYFNIPGRIINLVAGATCFAALTHEGHVLTWGDSRHPRCLARLPIYDEPAHTPGMVESFGGIPISKIDSGGWIFGALSVDRDLYLWGSGKPGSQDKLTTALGFGDDDVMPVDIPGVDNIIDFGIGSGHVVVVAEGGTIWVIGENFNGQLGLGEQASPNTVMEWTKVDIGGRLAVSAACGDLTTLITTIDARPSKH